MSGGLQLGLVIGIVVVAALYAVRQVGAQFRRSDDESDACASCPAKRAGRIGDVSRRNARD